MGAIAEGFVAFAQPLIDQTDGSLEQMNKAFALAQICFNLALSPEQNRHKLLNEIQSSLAMDDAEFDEFQRDVVVPMIQRHEEMFPRLHGRDLGPLLQRSPSPWVQPSLETPSEKPSVPDRYAPCPCNSGEKYKFCCGKKGR